MSENNINIAFRFAGNGYAYVTWKGTEIATAYCLYEDTISDAWADICHTIYPSLNATDAAQWLKAVATVLQAQSILRNTRNPFETKSTQDEKDR